MDELPAAAAEQASVPYNLAQQTARTQELPQQLHEPVSDCCNIGSEQNQDVLDCSSDLFDLPEDMDFGLPSLDSPEQAVCLPADATDKQQSACTSAQPTDGVSADEADKVHSGIQNKLVDVQLNRQVEEEAGVSGADPEDAQISAERRQDDCAKQGPLSALLTSEEVCNLNSYCMSFWFLR